MPTGSTISNTFFDDIKLHLEDIDNEKCAQEKRLQYYITWKNNFNIFQKYEYCSSWELIIFVFDLYILINKRHTNFFVKLMFSRNFLFFSLVITFTPNMTFLNVVIIIIESGLCSFFNLREFRNRKWATLNHFETIRYLFLRYVVKIPIDD